MRQLLWAEQAEADIAAILEEIAQRDPDEEQRLFDRIAVAPEILLEYPLLGAAVDGWGSRKWLIKQTPFLLLYRIDDQRVVVMRVMHGASDWTSLR